MNENKNTGRQNRAHPRMARRLFVDAYDARYGRKPYPWEITLGQALLLGDLQVVRPPEAELLRRIHLAAEDAAPALQVPEPPRSRMPVARSRFTGRHLAALVLTAVILLIAGIMSAQTFLPRVPGGDAPTTLPSPGGTRLVTTPITTVLPPTATPALSTITPTNSPTAISTATVPRPPTSTPRPTARPGIGPFWHFVQHGDTLWDLAEYYYGQGWLYYLICEANHLSGCDLIHAGNWLYVPRLS